MRKDRVAAWGFLSLAQTIEKVIYAPSKKYQAQPQHAANIPQ